MIEVRNDERGKLDEVVGKNCTVHLEQMNFDSWCLIIEDGTERLMVSLRRSKGSVLGTVYERAPVDSPTPLEKHIGELGSSDQPAGDV